MIAGPFLDLARVAIGSSVAVRSAAIVLLQPLLVLAFEFLLEHDPTDVGPPADARGEGLLALVATIAAMGFQKAVAALGEGDRTITALKRHEPHQAFVAQVTQVRLPQRFVSRIVEIALGHHPKRADGRQGTGCRRRSARTAGHHRRRSRARAHAAVRGRRRTRLADRRLVREGRVRAHEHRPDREDRCLRDPIRRHDANLQYVSRDEQDIPVLERLGAQDVVSGADFVNGIDRLLQLINGEFQAFGKNGRWVVIRAVDSSWWEVWSDDQSALEAVRAKFRITEDASPRA